MAEHRPYRDHERDADRCPSQKRSVAAEDQGAYGDARHHGERPLEVIDESALLIHEAIISHRGVGQAESWIGQLSLRARWSAAVEMGSPSG
jgi:hypothetical protein